MIAQNCSLSLCVRWICHIPLILTSRIHIKCRFDFIMHSRTITSSRAAANIFWFCSIQKSETVEFLLGASGVWAHKNKHMLWTFLLVITFHYSFLARSILFGELLRRFHFLSLVWVVSWANTTDSSVKCNALSSSFVAFSMLIIKNNMFVWEYWTLNSMWSIHLLALTIEIKMR